MSYDPPIHYLKQDFMYICGNKLLTYKTVHIIFHRYIINSYQKIWNDIKDLNFG